MKEKILNILGELRQYAINKGISAAFFYHEEDSYLMRFANSAISLNTNEHLVRLEITTYDGRKRAEYQMITDLNQVEQMKAGIDTAAEMMKHTQPLSYDPTIPLYTETYADESSYDQALAQLSNEEKLAYFNQAAEGLETGEITLSGIFSSGTNITAQINTRSEHTQYFKSSDAQVNLVLSHGAQKWEILAEQSAQQKADLDPAAVHSELAFLSHVYTTTVPQQIPVGTYDIVLGSAAIGDLLDLMNWIGFSGGMMKRGFSFTTQEQVGKPVFSEKFTLVDDPTRRETFPYKRDVSGIERKPFPLFTRGVFDGYTWVQDDADEYGAQPTGHTVMHKSLVLHCGDQPVDSLEALVSMPREKDLLYIPYLHYMNIVNPSRGLITGSSRFGALLLKKDGSVAVPFNVRLTQSLLDIFGEKLQWLSSTEKIANTSMSYGARNPKAIVLPAFIRVNGLEISHSNSAF
ncbi:MAG: hypothetical protein HPY85_00190 [Anaerolineae bacterium]|nr:hypothetical protein [Anaerolineae bacterium]